MAAILLLLSLTLCHAFSHQTLMLIRADDSLIQRECHNAEEPTICIQCVKSNPRAEKANEVGIATIVVDCLSNHASNLVANMSHLASNATDKASKEFYENCGQGFSNAKTELHGATQFLENGNYDNAHGAVSTALDYRFKSCGSEIEGGNSEVHIPPGVVYETRVFEELSEAAMRIIERL